RAHQQEPRILGAARLGAALQRECRVDDGQTLAIWRPAKAGVARDQGGMFSIPQQWVKRNHALQRAGSDRKDRQRPRGSLNWRPIFDFPRWTLIERAEERDMSAIGRE